MLFAFALPLGGAASLLISEQKAKIGVMERERSDLGFAARTEQLVRGLRKLRDRFELDRSAGREERRAVADALAALVALNAASERTPRLDPTLARLQSQWSEVPPGSGGSAEVTRVLATATSLFDLIDARTAGDADSDPATAELVAAYGEELPTLGAEIDAAELLLFEHATGPAAIADRIASAVELGRARRTDEAALNDLDAAGRNGAPLPGIAAELESVDSKLATFEALSGLATRAAGGSSLRVVSDQARDGVHGAYVDLIDAVGERIGQRQAAERRYLTLLNVETLLAVFVSLSFALLLARTIRERDRRDLGRAQARAERLALELERQRQLEILSVTEAQLRAVFDRSSIGVAILDQAGAVLRSNWALEEMLATIDVPQIGPGHPDFRRLLSGEIESFVTDLASTNRTGADASWYEATVSLVRDDGGAPRFAISMVKDITERKRTDDRLRHDATHDALSGLPNRAFFYERLESRFFSHESPGPGIHAVLFVDLDEFKFVNDSLGHGIGDRVIVAAGRRLLAMTDRNDCVARLGGDEFAVLLGGRESRDDIHALCDRIGRALADPLQLEGSEIYVTASIGIAFVTDQYRSVEEIVRDADTAMYFAKSNGRARSAIFNPAMHGHASRRLELATQLRRALERGQFYPAFQPVVSLGSGTIDAFEALLRWDHPDLGTIAPSEFIPVAEEIGLIVPIGRFVLDRACAQFARWKRESPEHCPRRISVNASVREIVQSDYVDTVDAIVREHGLLPGELMLEITETAILASGKFSFGTLERLKAVGVGLAIDDFGTGYSSLRYLQQFPFDELKVDRSFVSGTDGRLASEPICAMLVSLAKACGVGVVAEGVETAAQAAHLRAMGCTSAQGYLYGPPVRAASVPDLMRKVRAVASLA